MNDDDVLTTEDAERQKNSVLSVSSVVKRTSAESAGSAWGINYGRHRKNFVDSENVRKAENIRKKYSAESARSACDINYGRRRKTEKDFR